VLEAVAGEPGVHVVGGAVRDVELGRAPLELDLVVEGDASAVAARAARRLGAGALEHRRFGTVTVRGAGVRFDLAGARTERYAHPGALPEVALGASLAHDLQRRDFTVNAIAVAVDGSGRTQHPQALADLSAGWLRILHERSFSDDPTRLLRLARYRSRLGFSAEPATSALAADAVRGGALRHVSGTRIGAELRLLACEPDPGGALQALRDQGLAAALHVRLAPEADLCRRALALTPADASTGAVAMASACLGFGAGELASWLDEIAWPAAERDAIVEAAGTAPGLAHVLASGAEPPSRLAAAVGRSRPETVALAGALGAPGPAARWLQQERHVGLEIDGADLLAAGAAPGPALGAALESALAARRDGTVRGREQELAAALSALRGAGPGPS